MKTSELVEMTKTKCPICDYQFKNCQCMFGGSAHPDRHRITEVVTDHLYLLDRKQLKHVIALQRYWQTSYGDNERTEIFNNLVEQQRKPIRRTKILLALFRLTVRHPRLDWLTNIIVKLGGKKNYDRFYQLPH